MRFTVELRLKRPFTSSEARGGAKLGLDVKACP
jgi:hypothetical protein